jgi:diguanylate cyclase (GGDEF)-like protein
MAKYLVQMALAEQLTPASRAAEDARLAVMRRSGLLDRGPEPEFDRWTVALRRETGAAMAALSLLGPTQSFLKSFCTASGAAEEPEGVQPLESVSGYGAYLEAPVAVDGQILGSVSISDHVPRHWEESDLRALEDAAAAVSTEVRLRLAKEEAARVHELVASHQRVHELIARAAPLHDVLVELVNGIERYDPSVIACVVLLDRESSTLRPGAAPSLPPAYLEAIDGVVIGPNIGTCGSAAWSGRLTITDDIGEDPKWAPVRDFAIGIGLRHCWSMPIKTADGEVLGTLALYGPQPRHPLPEHLALMEDRASLAGIAIERHRTLGRLIHDARHDGLTGLPNRTAIFELLDEAVARLRPETLTAVLFVDLDGLKTLNDTLGHDRADEMIREFGERLSGAVRTNDFVGRFGGDEFVVIAEAISDEEEAAELGFRLLDSISQPLPGVESHVVTASIGVSLMSGPTADPREAIRQADTAMYAAKRSGRDRCVFFEGRRRIRRGRRLLLARELRDAEMRGEMSLVFQPVFELASTQIVGAEALLRWTSSTLGPVSPLEFIPIAEDGGSIVPLGAWVLRESCETVAQIAERAGRSLELGVNVSAHQVANPGFALSVQQTLAHAEFPADQLTLEITETSLVRPNTATARTLSELQALGVRIVLDDFGTGFSSLSWIKEHPLHAIKIDRRFIAGLASDQRDQAIVAGVIGMSRALGCTVTAEGVETEEQLAALRALDCERAQGFLLARPMSAEQLGALLG